LQNDFNGAFTVSYEADLFGRVRRQAEAATAGAAQAQADFENTRLVLEAELAADYFALRATDAETDILQRTLTAQGKVLDFIATRHELGAASALDLEQQQALVAATRTQLSLLADQRSRYEHAIATLVGKPAPDFHLPAVPTLVAVPAIPLAAPAELLQRRPDIAAAERAMAAANAQIGVARSAFFPAVMLSGQYGSDSNQLAHLFSAPSLLWGLGIGASQTLFDAGRTRATVAFAEAGYQQAVASYRQTVLVAMQEVQDGLSSSAHLGQALASARSAADSSSRALALSSDRYAVGVANQLELLLAETNFLNYQRQFVQLQGQQLVNGVRLVKALGGGWRVEGSGAAKSAEVAKLP
ncbi:MAG: efflux transporter outer membrane subunit, partial [Betaproteobacteria bacterium]|nr:efflux transporter outer membrane subunit [Betaproteobacteria bacterium]